MESVTTSSPIVSAKQVCKSYGKVEVLQQLDLEIAEQGIYGLLGRNGAGKSTLMRLLLGIDYVDSGRVKVFGLDPAQHGVAVRQRVGYVAQEQKFYAWMTPADLGRFVGGLYPRWDSQQYQQLLDRFELPARRANGPFSGGMKARLALALALASQPELLMLDEPAAGLDPVARREFLQVVSERCREFGTTTLFSTHLIEDVQLIADRISVINAGASLFSGPLTELVHQFVALRNNAVEDSRLTVALQQRGGLNVVETTIVDTSDHRARLLIIHVPNEAQRRELRFDLLPQLQAQGIGTGWAEVTPRAEDVIVSLLSTSTVAPNMMDVAALST